MPEIARQRELLKTLVDDWSAMTLEERKRLVGLAFKEVHADKDAGGIVKFLVRPDWRPYMRATVGVLERANQRNAEERHAPLVGKLSGRRESSARLPHRFRMDGDWVLLAA